MHVYTNVHVRMRESTTEKKRERQFVEYVWVNCYVTMWRAANPDMSWVKCSLFWLTCSRKENSTLNNLVPDLFLKYTSDQTEEETLQWQYDVLQKYYFAVLFKTFYPDNLRPRLQRSRRTCVESWFGSHFREALLGFYQDQETLLLDEWSPAIGRWSIWLQTGV